MARPSICLALLHVDDGQKTEEFQVTQPHQDPEVEWLLPLKLNCEFTPENWIWIAKEGPNPFLLGRERAYLGAMFVSFREGNSLRIIQQKSLMKKISEESVVETKIAWEMFHWKTLIRQVRVKRGIVFYVTS